jgi:hypothetical protein
VSVRFVLLFWRSYRCGRLGNVKISFSSTSSPAFPPFSKTPFFLAISLFPPAYWALLSQNYNFRFFRCKNVRHATSQATTMRRTAAAAKRWGREGRVAWGTLQQRRLLVAPPFFSSEQKTRFQEDGFVVVDRLIDPSLAEAIKDRFPLLFRYSAAT